MIDVTDKATHLSHDYETYSELDVTEVGAWAYSQHPSTEVLFWAIKPEGEQPTLWTPGGYLPREALEPEKYTWCAWNAFFEYCIGVNVLKLPPLPVQNIVCTQALALSLALPPELGECGLALGLDESSVKNPRGKALINLLSKPDKNGLRNRDPDLLVEFGDYCKQDTVAETAIKDLCRPLIPQEREVWEADFTSNIRGVPLDTDLLRGAAKVYRDTKEPLKKELIKRTGLANPNSGPQFKGWLLDQGYDFPNLQKATMESFLATCDDPELAQVIRWRSSLARTPISKYEKTIEKMGTDGRYHGALRYHKATTGRWASLGVNFQNLTRPTLDDHDIETCIEVLKTGDAELFAAIYDDPIEALSSCLRGMVCARPGYRLVVADYNSIEARVLAWLAGQRDKLEVFRTHGKVYEHTACQLFGVADIEAIGKKSPERVAGKVSELALGFQGGYRALIGMAVSNGVDLAGLAKKLADTDEVTFAKRIVGKWRAANPKIEQLWADTEKAALRAMRDPGAVVRVNKYLAFKKIRGILLMQLPSGRQLSFFGAHLSEGRYGDQISYQCTSPKTGKMFKKHTYGGDLAQSATQGTARDIMAYRIPELERQNYPVVLLVHDEILAEVPEGTGSLQGMIDIMCEQPTWAPGLPIAASGYEAMRMKKD